MTRTCLVALIPLHHGLWDPSLSLALHMEGDNDNRYTNGANFEWRGNERPGILNHTSKIIYDVRSSSPGCKERSWFEYVAIVS